MGPGGIPRALAPRWGGEKLLEKGSGGERSTDLSTSDDDDDPLGSTSDARVDPIADPFACGTRNEGDRARTQDARFGSPSEPNASDRSARSRPSFEEVGNASFRKVERAARPIPPSRWRARPSRRMNERRSARRGVSKSEKATQHCSLSAFIRNGIKKDRLGWKNRARTDRGRSASGNGSRVREDSDTERKKLENVIGSILFGKKSDPRPRHDMDDDGMPDGQKLEAVSSFREASRVEDAPLHACLGASLHDSLQQSLHCLSQAQTLHEQLHGECVQQISNIYPSWGHRFMQLGQVIEQMNGLYNRALEHLYLQFALATHPSTLRVGKAMGVEDIMQIKAKDEVESLLRVHLNVCTLLKIREDQLGEISS